MAAKRLLIVLTPALCLCALAGADGMKFPPRDVELYPNIPSQRALISFRDGVEHLTIESTYDGEGESFGWIVPVPATPTAIEEGSSGAIETVSAAMQPEVREATATLLTIPAIPAITFAITLATLVLIVAPRTSAGNLSCVVLSILAAFVAAAVLLPRLFAVKQAELGAPPPQLDVTVEMSAVAGDLDVEVLKAGNAADLDAWLQENGYKGLPEAGLAIVEDYIAQDWRFCAAKERRSGGGVTRTHALRISFPTEQPVYPMRLTALAGNDVALRLFVIADSAMASPPLEVQRSRRFHLMGEDDAPWVDSRGREDHPAMIGGGNIVWQPRAVAEMWDGCTVTHLAGVVESRQMTQDIHLHAEGETGAFKTYLSPEAARLRALQVGGIIGGAALLLALGLLYRFSYPARRRRGAAAAALAVGIFAASVSGFVLWLLTPIAASEAPGNLIYAGDSLALLHHRPQFSGSDVWRPYTEAREMVEVEEATLAVLRKLGVEEGDGPLEYELWRDEQGLWVRWHDSYGYPEEIPIGHIIPPYGLMADLDQALIPALVLTERPDVEAAQRAMPQLEEAWRKFHGEMAEAVAHDPAWEADLTKAGERVAAAAEHATRSDLPAAHTALEGAHEALAALRDRLGMEYFLDGFLPFREVVHEIAATAQDIGAELNPEDAAAIEEQMAQAQTLWKALPPLWRIGQLYALSPEESHSFSECVRGIEGILGHGNEIVLPVEVVDAEWVKRTALFLNAYANEMCNLLGDFPTGTQPVLAL